jgi:spore germination protein KB
LSKKTVRISPRQLTFLVITLIISTSDIFLPAFVAQEAGRDSWLSAILATAVMFPVMWIILKLYRYHEGKSLIHICAKVAGKPFGIVIGLLYVFYFLFVAQTVVIEMGQVLNTAFLPQTPSWVIITLSILVSLYAVSRDIEVIARVNEILVPLGIGAFGLLMFANLKDLDLTFFLPILNEGVLPPILGAFVILGFFSELIVFLQIFHFNGKPEQLSKAVNIGILATGITILGGTLIYALFGPLTEVYSMPALEFARYASIGRYIQNLDILVTAIWVTGIYVKIIMFCYVGTYALAQVFGIREYKSLVLPVGLLTVVMALASETKAVALMHFLHYILPFYGATVAFLIPALLLLVSLVRKSRGEDRKSSSTQSKADT